ncbi:MAG TPA: hypothetical protein VFD70_03910 [Anaerolineae bacterium]|nr:hypothetical protein [Anaerolineae bacterium]
MDEPIRDGLQEMTQEAEDEMMGEMNRTIHGEVVNITQGGVRNIDAQSVTVKQGGVQNVSAEVVTVKQGGIVQAEGGSVEVVQGGIGLARGDQVKITAGGAFAILGSNVQVEAGGAQWMLARQSISVDQGGAAAMIAPKMDVNNSFVGLILAQQVTGSVRTLFDTRAALVFGIAAGVVGGLVLSMRRR